MMTPGRTARRGFTMTEMIVAVIIIAILGASMTRLLVSQAHLFQKAAAQRGTRSVTRSAMNMIDSDLRMVEATNGVVSATSTQLVVRSPYAVGVVCGTSGGVTTVSIAPVDSTQWANAGLSGYAWRDTLGVYTYQETNVSVASGTPSVCTNNSIATMTGGKVIAVSPQMPAGAVVGAFMFFEEQLSYEFKASVAVPGTIGLWRTVVKTSSADELVSPFTSNAAFKFYVLNRDTSQVAVPSPLSNIRGFEFVLAARSVNTPVGSTGPITTTVNTSVFFRNRLN
jgi:prepilin-type N-terminal cleavage/methylation domain-containing protein